VRRRGERASSPVRSSRTTREGASPKAATTAPQGASRGRPRVWARRALGSPKRALAQRVRRPSLEASCPARTLLPKPAGASSQTAKPGSSGRRSKSLFRSK